MSSTTCREPTPNSLPHTPCPVLCGPDALPSGHPWPLPPASLEPSSPRDPTKPFSPQSRPSSRHLQWAPTAPQPQGVISKAGLRGPLLGLLGKHSLWGQNDLDSTHSRTVSQPCDGQVRVVTQSLSCLHWKWDQRLMQGEEGAQRAGLRGSPGIDVRTMTLSAPFTAGLGYLELSDLELCGHCSSIK